MGTKRFTLARVVTRSSSILLNPDMVEKIVYSCRIYDKSHFTNHYSFSIPEVGKKAEGVGKAIFKRVGVKLAGDMKMGVLGQINLEAGERKCIVVPYGDLFLCLLTRADANLGLIRLAIRNLQAKVIL